MIYLQARVHVLDNSGARLVEIFKVLRSKKQHPVIGSEVVVAVKRAVFNKKVKKHEVKHAVLVQTRKVIYRKQLGISFKFFRNSVVILGRGLNPLATRIKGTVTQELRRFKFLKVLTMAPSVI